LIDSVKIEIIINFKVNSLMQTLSSDEYFSILKLGENQRIPNIIIGNRLKINYQNNKNNNIAL